MGPMIPPTGRMEVNMPTARSRSAPKWSATIPVADGMKAPPPRAWMNRGTSRRAILGAAPHRGNGEAGGRDREHLLAAVHVTDLARHRHRDDLAEGVDRDRPAAPVDPGVQVVLDRGQRGGDNGLVDRGHAQADGDDGEDQPAPLQRSDRDGGLDLYSGCLRII